jgi:glutamate/tyrosine decarboxylase-like PLP-dependent enzyme
MPLRTQSSLDVTDDALREISSEATKLVSEYMATIGERPVRSENYAGKTTQSINTELSVEGLPLDQLLAECRTIMDLSRHNGHPRFFGYVASPSTPIGAYGDLIASALNATLPAGAQVQRAPRSNASLCVGWDRSSVMTTMRKAC